MDTKLAKASVASRCSVIRDGVRVNVTGRRTYSEAFKRSVVKDCLTGGVSVASIGLKHGINPNLLRKWIRRRQQSTPPTAVPILLPVKLDGTKPRREPIEVASGPSVANSGSIEIEIGEGRVRVHGAVDVDALCCVLGELRRR